MRETEDLVSEPALGLLYVIETRAPSPRNYEARLVPLDSQVLQIVIVPRQIKRNVPRLEIARPFCYQAFVVRAFGRFRKQREVAHNPGPRRFRFFAKFGL